MFDVYAKETCHCSLIYDDGKYPNFTHGPPAAQKANSAGLTGRGMCKAPDPNTLQTQLQLNIQQLGFSP